jgi:hypothetical protein
VKKNLSVESIKYLGVIIDEKLKFDKNILAIQKKVGVKINFIQRLGGKLNKFSKITLYKSIILPHFDYCSSILFLANDGEFQALQKLQNRMMRLILKCRSDTPIRQMLLQLKFLSVRQRINNNTLVLLFKMERGLLPEFLCCNLNQVHNMYTHNTRGGSDFTLP